MLNDNEEVKGAAQSAASKNAVRGKVSFSDGYFKLACVIPEKVGAAMVSRQ